MRCAPSYDSARLELSYTEIRAPIAGVVSARHIKVGNTIKPNDPTFRITDLDPLIAYVHIPEKEFRKLAPGPERGRRRRCARRRALRRHDLAHQPDGRPADRHVPRARRSAGQVAPAEARHVRARQHRLRPPPRRAAVAAHGDPRCRRRAVGLHRRERQGRAAHDPHRPRRTAAGSRWSKACRATSSVVVGRPGGPQDAARRSRSSVTATPKPAAAVAADKAKAQ